MEVDIKKEGSFFMRNAYEEGKRKYRVRYLSTAKRLSKEEIASMSREDIDAEMAAADRMEEMCEKSSPDKKMLLSNSVDLVIENSHRMIQGVCGIFAILKGQDYERYGIRFQDVPADKDCVSLESLFDESVQVLTSCGISIDYSKIGCIYAGELGGYTFGVNRYERFAIGKKRKNDIIIDSRLFTKDIAPSVRKSVMVHELIHMIKGNHGFGFIRIARSIMNAYPELKLMPGQIVGENGLEAKYIMKWSPAVENLYQCEACGRLSKIDNRVKKLNRKAITLHPELSAQINDQSEAIICPHCYAKKKVFAIARRVRNTYEDALKANDTSILSFSMRLSQEILGDMTYEDLVFELNKCYELKQFLSGLPTLFPRDNAIRNMNNYNIRMLKKEMKKRDEARHCEDE